MVEDSVNEPEGKMSVPHDGRKIIYARQGQSVVVHLWEDRTRGEEWVPVYDSSVLALIDDDFLRTTSNNAVDSGQRTFEFQTLLPGQYPLTFDKRLAWKYTAEDRRVFLVNVDSPPA